MTGFILVFDRKITLFILCKDNMEQSVIDRNSIICNTMLKLPKVRVNMMLNVTFNNISDISWRLNYQCLYNPFQYICIEYLFLFMHCIQYHTRCQKNFLDEFVSNSVKRNSSSFSIHVFVYGILLK